MTARLLVVTLLALVLAGPSFASNRHPTLTELEGEVMCPTCHTLLELSNSPLAERMRAFIRHRIAAGDTKSEIEQKLVREFGEGILAAPPTNGFGLLAWALPLVGLLAAATLVAVIAHKWRRNSTTPTPPIPDAMLDTELEQRLDEELKLYEGSR